MKFFFQILQPFELLLLKYLTIQWIIKSKQINMISIYFGIKMKNLV